MTSVNGGPRHPTDPELLRGSRSISLIQTASRLLRDGGYVGECFEEICRFMSALFLSNRGTTRAETLPPVNGDVFHDGRQNYLVDLYRYDLLRQSRFAYACCYEPLYSSDSFRH